MYKLVLTAGTARNDAGFNNLPKTKAEKILFEINNLKIRVFFEKIFVKNLMLLRNSLLL